MSSQTSTQTATVVIVSDGQYQWGADAARLLAALEDQGWERTVTGYGREVWYTEPERPGEDNLAAYTDLCGAVDELAGYESGTAFEAPEDAGALTYRPDLGAGVWTYDAPGFII